MVSRRSRSKNTVGGQLNSLAAAVEKTDKKAGLGAGAVDSGNLAENAVDRNAVAPNAIGPEQIDRGAVGTENLGIVNEIKADASLNVVAPDGLLVNGSPIIGGSSGVAAMPAGSIMPWATDTAPDGWLIADGSAVSRTTYEDLFATIGTTYGVGNGTTTFNLPNYKGAVLVGKDAAQTEFDSLTDSGGAKTHTLSTAEMPSHTHGPGAGTNFTIYRGTGGQIGSVAGSNQDFAPTTAATGGGGAHNNLQPYKVVNYIIKYTVSDGLQGETGEPGDVIEAGVVMATASATVPTNWLLCDGSAVSRATWPSLFAAIGTTYGAGNGSTTFNLPDYRGRTLVGLDVSQTEFDTLGEAGGEKTHLLTAAESGLRAHSHSIDARATSGASGSGDGLMRGTGASDPNFRSGTFLGSTGTYNSAAVSADATSAHNNLQPYRVANYIIKGSAGFSPSDSVLTTRVSALEAYSGANRPVFHVKHTTTMSNSGTQNEKLMNFNTIVLNQGSCWNGTTSRFTAPVAGLYEFEMGLCNTAATGGPESGIFKNGVLVEYLCIAYVAYNTAHGTYKLNLAAGDYVQPFFRNNNNTSVVIDGTRSFFAGKLIS